MIARPALLDRLIASVSDQPLTLICGRATRCEPWPPGPLAALTDRELEVLAPVAAGASNKHIARDLALSLHTVKRHIANILDKLDCTSRGQAADHFRRAQPG